MDFYSIRNGGIGNDCMLSFNILDSLLQKKK